MNLRIKSLLLFALAGLISPILAAAPTLKPFEFSVIGRYPVDDATLGAAIQHTSTSNSTFVVVNGLRPPQETCSDSAYTRRKMLLTESVKPLFVSLASRDWAECIDENGASAAQNRLNFLRAMMLEEGLTRWSEKLPTVHLSSSARFRNHSESMRWEVNGVLFATINLPSNNNHHLAAAGRNHEFDDRQVANRHWLMRIFAHAKNRQLKSIVLFSDANPMATSARSRRRDRRDGFAEVRRQIARLTARFSGKVLIVHGRPASGNVTWRDNLGVIGTGRHVLQIAVRPKAKMIFSVRRIGRVQALLRRPAK